MLQTVLVNTITDIVGSTTVVETTQTDVEIINITDEPKRSEVVYPLHLSALSTFDSKH